VLKGSTWIVDLNAMTDGCDIIESRDVINDVRNRRALGTFGHEPLIA